MRENYCQNIEAVLRDENKKRFSALSKGQKKIVVLLDRVRSDYLTFLLGIISAMVMEGFLGLFTTRVADNPLGFVLAVSNTVLFFAASVIFVRFTAMFSKLQAAMESQVTRTAGYNSLINHFDDFNTQTNRMVQCVRAVTILCLTALGLNILYFAYTNFFAR